MNLDQELAGGFEWRGLPFPVLDINNAQLDGIAHQIQGAVQIEFGHDIGLMILGGFGTDVELLGNVFNLDTFGQQAEDLLLSGSQAAINGIGGFGLLFRELRQLFNKACKIFPEGASLTTYPVAPA